MKREMTEIDVIELLELCDRLQITIWLDGGWAVDALLGEQTRRHEDVDIVVERDKVQILVDALQQMGFHESLREEFRPWNFVLVGDAGREVDFHVIEFDQSGNGLYGPPDGGKRYEAAALQGSGVIQGHPVRCITADWLVAYHTGYEVDARDWKDVAALCAKFDIPMPSEYDRFVRELIVRPARIEDLEQMLALADDRRREYSKYQPVFWRPAAEAIARQCSYFERLIADGSVITLVATAGEALLGFVIGQLIQAPVVYDPGGPTCSIDDFAVNHPESWATVGVALLNAIQKEAREGGAAQLVVVCGHLDKAKRAALESCQLTIASEWWVAPLIET